MSSLQDMLSELADHGFQDESQTRLIGMLNDAYFDVCSRLPWPFLEKRNTSVTTTNGNPSISMPADFAQVLSLTYPSATGVVQWTRLDDFQKRYVGQENQAGQPVLYYMIGGQINLWPVPDQAYTLILNYLSFPSAMKAAADTPIFPARHHRVVVLGAAVRLYAMEDDLASAQAFDNWYEQRIATMQRDLYDQQYDRPDMVYDIREWQDDYFNW